MSYSQEQFNATKKYILDFFKLKSRKFTLNEREFSEKLDTLFKEIRNGFDVKFEFSRKNEEMEDLVAWIDRKKMYFPTNFSVILTNDGASIGKNEGVITEICKADPNYIKKPESTNRDDDLIFEMTDLEVNEYPEKTGSSHAHSQQENKNISTLLTTKQPIYTPTAHSQKNLGMARVKSSCNLRDAEIQFYDFKYKHVFSNNK